MNQLTKYIIALTNLYGMVHKDKVVEIYNEQNEDQININKVESFINNPPVELEDEFIQIYKDYFVHETVLEFDDVNVMLANKADKPYYVPKQSELLKYVEDGYFEETKEYKKLLNYVKKNFFNGDEEKAEMLCEDIYGTCQYEFKLQTIFDSFTGRDITFKDENQVNEVLQLVMELSNNMRLWENNGYTPQEIFEELEKPNLRLLPDKPFDFGNSVKTVVKKEKIGRNDPCPCGSGKKYKKCCLGKNE